MSEKTVWGIHAGKTGDADSLFLHKNVVALGWHEMGNMRQLSADREAFKGRVSSIRPDWSPSKVANAAGHLYRFVHEMQVGDIVVYPSKLDRQIHIGEVIGTYEYRTEPEKTYPNTRAVKWLRHVPRTAFSQGALYKAGSALSFFQIENYADEFLGVLERKTELAEEP